MKKIIGIFSLLSCAILQAQHVGIGTNNPLARLHLAGSTPYLYIDNGAAFFRDASTDNYFQMSNFGEYMVLNNFLGPNATTNFRFTDGTKEIVLSGKGIAIAQRTILGDNIPQVPLDIRADAEAVRIAGINPYLSMQDGGVQWGYLQAWTDGIALASNGYDVGLWTNGAKRLAVKPSGALEIAGNTGTAGQVLTSNGSGSPAQWTSATNTLLYNSFRFFPMTGGVTFINTSNSVWRDVPGMTYSFTLAGNTYVDVAAVFASYGNGCIGCDQPKYNYRLLINGNVFTSIAGKAAGGLFETSNSVTTGFTLPAGNHTIKWQVNSFDGSDLILSNIIGDSGNKTYMRVWMVPQ